ncbi:MAG: helix-turn-helix domain-containing protein, partial [Acidobacteria bacterium]|nr:helix-turn-helix domain-containing protein [Acidobacteriota bacterium]
TELKEWREKRGLAREDLAALLENLSVRTVEGWEQDRFKIPTFLPLALAEIDRRLNPKGA